MNVLRAFIVVLGLSLLFVLTTAEDWPTYLHDSQHSDKSSETVLGTSTVPQLAHDWLFTTGGTIGASPVVVGNTVYIGSWDGFEYALDATTGALKWKSPPLGQTNVPTCSPPNLGVESTATVLNGVVYVGGGGPIGASPPQFYALDARTGAILWSVPTVPAGYTGASTDYFNWSSPAISPDGKYAYVGVASNCDNPLVRGGALKIDLSAHQVVGSWHSVPSGQVGGGVWTSPAIETDGNTVYVTTGTQGPNADNNFSLQPQAVAAVAINASDMSLKSSWQITQSSAVFDSDWGTSPTMFTDGTRNLFAAINKNGLLYAFDRGDVGAGPVWSVRVADAKGSCPQCGDSSVSSGAFDGSRLYMGTGKTTINGIAVNGSVRAFNPATGAILWEHAAAGYVMGALAYDNGFIVDGAGQTIEVLRASDGAVLYSLNLGSTIYSSPTVSGGRIFAATVDGNVHSFTLSSCAASWTCQDVGSPAVAGAQSQANGTWNVTGGGTDVWGTADQFRYAWQPAGSTESISARVVHQTNSSDWAKAGVMLRGSTDAGAPYYFVMATPQHGVNVQWRSAQGAVAQGDPTSVALAPPVYLKAVRSGSSFSAYTSTDGSSWTLVPGSTQTIAMPSSALAGLADCGHSATAPSVVAFDSVQLATLPGAPLNPSATPGDGQATVTWQPPSSDGGSRVTGYTVTASPGGQTATTSGATSAVVTGLTNGTQYTFTVTATNALGTGPASGSSNVVTPAGLPGAPTNVTASPGNAAASVTWTKPADNGSSITGYKVTASPGGQAATTTGATSATVTGLTNGTQYTFTVTATNGVGTGAASGPSNPVTPAAVPDAPTSVSASPGDTSVGVSWTKPSDNGSAISGYKVVASPGGQSANVGGADNTSAVVSGLSNGTPYTFTVTATNGVGTGPASAPSNTAVPGPPPAPTGVSASAGDSSATVNWSESATGYAPITGYTVTASPGGQTASAGPTATSTVVSGLANGTQYIFTVTATNRVGTSTASAASNPVTPGAQPAVILPAPPAGITFLGGVAPVQWSGSHLEVFVRGSDNALYHASSDDAGSTWTGWSRLGGCLLSGPGAVSWAPGRIDVIVEGCDRSSYHLWLDSTGWHGWENLGGVATAAPAVAAWAPNRLDVLVRGTDGAVWHKAWDGHAWHAWENLGGVTLGGPGATSWGNNRLDIVARGTDRAIWHKWWDGTAWRGWLKVACCADSAPATSSIRANQLSIFVLAAGQLREISWTGSTWTGLLNQGGTWSPDPGAVAVSGSAAVFLRAGDGSVQMVRIAGG